MILVLILIAVGTAWLVEWYYNADCEARRNNVIAAEAKLFQFRSLTADVKSTNDDRRALLRLLIPLMIDVFELEQEIELGYQNTEDDYQEVCERSVGLALFYFQIDDVKEFRKMASSVFQDRVYEERIFGLLNRRSVSEFELFLERAFEH